MRRGRILIYLSIILILGLVAIFLVYQNFFKPSSKPTTSTAPVSTPVITTVNIVVTTQKVSRGNVLDEKVVQVVPFPQNMLVQGMITDINKAVGRVAKMDLDPHVILTDGMIAEKGELLSSVGSNASLSIPRGMVAVSIPISRLSSVSYAPQAGDHVNVMITMAFVDMDTDFQTRLPNGTTGVVGPGTGKLTSSADQNQSLTQGPQNEQMKRDAKGTSEVEVASSSVVAMSGSGGGVLGRAEVDAVFGQTFYLVPSEVQRPRITSQTLLQDVVVLRVGDFPLQGQVAGTSPEESMGAAPTPQPAAGGQAAQPVVEIPQYITLIVSPQDAVTLNYLMYSGAGGGAALTLALRSAGDDTRIQTEAVTLQFLLDQYRIPVPVKLPYGMEPKTDRLVEPTPVSVNKPTTD